MENSERKKIMLRDACEYIIGEAACFMKVVKIRGGRIAKRQYNADFDKYPQ